MSFISTGISDSRSFISGGHLYLGITHTWGCSYLGSLIPGITHTWGNSFLGDRFSLGVTRTWGCSYLGSLIPWGSLFLGGHSYLVSLFSWRHLYLESCTQSWGSCRFRYRQSSDQPIVSYFRVISSDATHMHELKLGR